MADRWQEYMPLRTLQRAHRNPKMHDTAGIRASVARHGFVEPVTMDERTMRLVAGHGRLDDLEERARRREDPPDGIKVDPDNGDWLIPVNRGWESKSDADAEAYLIGANELTMRGGYDRELLAQMLGEYRDDADWFLGTGYNPDDIAGLLLPPEAAGGGGEPSEDEDDIGSGVEPSRGTLLALADISVAEPRHQVAKGDVYRIGTHVLVVADVMTGWPLWAPLLAGDALFVPYPGPYAALTKRAAARALVLVQPDPYLAGHLLDKYESVRGAGSVVHER